MGGIKQGEMRIRRLLRVVFVLSLVGYAQVHAAPADIYKQDSTHTEPATEQDQVELQPQKKERPAKSEKKKQAKTQVKPAPARPAPAPTYAVGCEHYRKLVSQYSWNVEVAMAVMFAESGCNPAAANWADNHGVCMGSFGLFQISCHGGQIHDPASNVAAAWAKYESRRWQPWSVCTTGKVNCY